MRHIFCLFQILLFAALAFAQTADAQDANTITPNISMMNIGGSVPMSATRSGPNAIQIQCFDNEAIIVRGYQSLSYLFGQGNNFCLQRETALLAPGAKPRITADGHFCRQYQRSLGNNVLYGSGCLQSDGTWQLQN